MNNSRFYKIGTEMRETFDQNVSPSQLGRFNEICKELDLAGSTLKQIDDDIAEAQRKMNNLDIYHPLDLVYLQRDIDRLTTNIGMLKDKVDRLVDELMGLVA